MSQAMKVARAAKLVDPKHKEKAGGAAARKPAAEHDDENHAAARPNQ